jgi:copper transport protein
VWHRRTPPIRSVAVAVAVATVVLLTPSVALAHAGVIRTTPADGERLETSPPALVIEFTEPVGLDPDGVRLVDDAGARVALPGPAVASGARVTQPLPSLTDGWYLASWSVVSTDGHVVHGAIAFAVGDATGPPPATSGDDPSIPLAIARAAADLGLIVAVGAIAAWVLLHATSVRVRRLALGASLLGTAGSLVVAGLTVAEGGQAAAGGLALMTTVVRGVLLVGVAGLVYAAARRPSAWRIALIVGAAALVTMMFGGHPNESVLTATLLLAHLSAAALWLGAAPAVLLLLLDGAVGDADAITVVRRFSKVATWALFVAVGGGSLLALALTDAELEGLDPRYLGLLMAKIAMVVVAAILGAFTRRRLAKDTAGRPSLKRLFVVDSILLVVVITCSAGLTVGPPKSVVAAADGIHIGHCSLEMDDGVASLSLVPARVGDNTVHLDGAGDVEHALVELRLAGEAGAIEIDLTPNGDGWSGKGSIPVAGVWEATVAIGRDQFTEERLACQIRMEP